MRSIHATEAQFSQIVDAPTEEVHVIASEQGISAAMRDAVLKLAVGRLQKVMASSKAMKTEVEHATEQEMRAVYQYLKVITTRNVEEEWVELEEGDKDEED
ncbi:hypothetical protein LTR95_000634 [Oleoguttula sp. CCFEE 5521]